jgi:hypothetical protein
MPPRVFRAGEGALFLDPAVLIVNADRAALNDAAEHAAGRGFGLLAESFDEVADLVVQVPATALLVMFEGKSWKHCCAAMAVAALPGSSLLEAWIELWRVRSAGCG